MNWGCYIVIEIAANKSKNVFKLNVVLIHNVYAFDSNNSLEQLRHTLVDFVFRYKYFLHVTCYKQHTCLDAFVFMNKDG